MLEKNIRNSLLAGLCVFAFVLLFYSPILFHDFAYHNDYRIWDSDNQSCCLAYPESRHLIGVGRPILALLLNAQLMFVNNIAAVKISHASAIFLIATCALFLTLMFLRDLNISLHGSAILSALIFTLPSMAINAFWMTNLVSGILAIMIVLVAQWHYQRHPAIAFVLIFVSLFIYPPSTFFFLGITLIKFLFGQSSQSNATPKSLLIEVGIIFLASLLYFLSIKLLLKPLLINLDPGGHNWPGGLNWVEYYKKVDEAFRQYQFAIDLLDKDKIHQFGSLSLIVLSAWFPLLGVKQAAIMFAIGGFILFFTLPQNPYLSKFNGVNKVAAGLLIFLLAWILTATPLLAGPASYEVNYRVSFAPMAMIPALLVLAMEKGFVLISRQAKIAFIALIFLGGLVVAGEIFSLNRLLLVVKFSSQEWKRIFVAVDQRVTNKTREIRVQLPIIYNPDPHLLHADFGLNATDIGIKGVVRLALRETHRNPRDFSVTFGAHFPAGNEDGVLLIPRIHTQIDVSQFIGKWKMNGHEAKIEVVDISTKRLRIVNELGVASNGIIENGDELRSYDWNISADLSSDRKELKWSNGSKWTR